MKPNINKLKPTKFTTLTPTRDAIIDQASAGPIRQASSYLANQIASALHPAVQHVVVADIKERAADVKSYTLVADTARGTQSLAYFSAGQYLSITLRIGDAVVTRPYSISSSPKEALQGKYELTIKRVEGGLCSQYILDNFVVGTQLDVSAPMGSFTYEPLRDAGTVIGVAGGSGITPFVSLAKSIADGKEDCNLVLLYGSRTLEDSLFAEELDAIARSTPRFKLVRVLSQGTAPGCESGFIGADLIRKYAPAGDYSVFLCGPQGMYRFVDKELEKLSLRRKFIRHELFGEIHSPEQNPDYPAVERDTFEATVHMCGETKKVTISAHDTILVGLEKAGIAVPAHCRSGECGWCHSQLISGEVYIPRNVDYRRAADIQYGYIHPCCTFAVSDITIDVPIKA